MNYKSRLTREQVNQHIAQIKALNNRARFAQAHRLARQLKKRYPRVLDFAYIEAVMTAEDDINYSKAENRRRYRAAANKLRDLLRRLRGAPLDLRHAIRNEYYWFSQQPLKQYRLGVERGRRSPRRGHYSQGVGAAMLAKHYALRGNRRLCEHWAKISEKAWLRFFQIDANWFNSYFFYAQALGLQGRHEDMEKALKKSASIARKPPGWKALTNIRRDVQVSLKSLAAHS